jgi:two-component system, NarL family, invasion response regulator UvrY
MQSDPERTLERKRIDVLVVDDHPVVVEGVRRRLAKAEEIRIIDAALSGEDALRKVSDSHYDVVLLDITLPGKSGFDVLGAIRIDRPHLPVLMFSLYPEIPYALRMLKAGAAGYLYKEYAPGHLAEAIQQVSSGHLFISPTLARHLARQLTTDPLRTLHSVLSDLEFRVLHLIASGKDVAQIAVETQLSELVVDEVRLRIFEITNIFTAADLAEYAVRTGVL